MFQAGWLNAYTQTACWVVIFFFASCGKSLEDVATPLSVVPEPVAA